MDAASIAVPTLLHVAVAREFLRRGIPLMVEKPLAPDLAGADELAALGARAAPSCRSDTSSASIPPSRSCTRRATRPLLVRAQRVGPFTGRSTDVGVVLDLMIHDLDLLLALVGSSVRTVTASGLSVFGGHEDVASARLEFANGCTAEVMASRASAVPSRVMQVWSAEGYAELDFAQRRLTLVQPSDEVRRHGLDPARLDPASRARLRDELFGRHLQTRVIDGKAQDQLTAELQHFVSCVRSGSTPRVTGADGRDAVALAHAILHEIRSHAWDGPAGLRGPHQLPAPRGPLFQREADQEVA